MPFDLVIDEQTVDGQDARVSKTSVCGSWGAIAGELRYFADRFGIPRASIEGTQIPADLLRKYATRRAPELTYDARRRHAPLAVTRRVEYFGFELERESEPLDEFPPELAADARRALADALARSEARHIAVKRNRAAIEEVRELWRRSGGRTPRLGLQELAALYAEQLAEIDSMAEFRAAPLRLRLDELVTPEDRELLGALPDEVSVRDRDVAIDYDVEETDGRPQGVARLRLPEKLARTLTEAELPALDRPLRFVVLRGQRGSVRASTLDELQDALDRPWSPDEVAEPATPYRDGLPGDEREVKAIARELRRGGAGGRGKRGERDSRSGGQGGRGGERRRGPGDADGRDGRRSPGFGGGPGGGRSGRGGRRRRRS
jgi:hypothetical protein